MPAKRGPSPKSSGSGCSVRRLITAGVTAGALLLVARVWLAVSGERQLTVARPTALATPAAAPTTQLRRDARRAEMHPAKRLSGGERPPPPPPSPQQHSAAATRRGCEPLGPAMVHAAAASNALKLLVVTFVNAAQGDFALNWLEHLAQVGLRESALVGATDATVARSLGAAGARCFPLESGIGAEEAKWGSPGFAQMGRSKALLTRRLLEPQLV